MHRDIDITNFADGNTPYTSTKNIDDVIEPLDQASVSLKWFKLNLLKGNVDQFHFLTKYLSEVSLNVDTFSIKKSKGEKLLEVKFDSKLTFDQHISDLCQRSSRKVNTLPRITPYMSFPKRRLLINSFIKTYSSYCPLI